MIFFTVHPLCFSFSAAEDGYAIDIFSFGICALEVREIKMCVTFLSVFLHVCDLTNYLCSMALDGGTGDPSQWRYCCFQGGHCQCRSISRRPSHESEYQKCLCPEFTTCNQGNIQLKSNSPCYHYPTHITLVLSLNLTDGL